MRGSGGGEGEALDSRNRLGDARGAGALGLPLLRPEGRVAVSCPKIVPITVKAARRFISETHRHLPRVQGALFAVGVEFGGEVIAVGTAGNPWRVWQGTGRIVITRVAVAKNVPWNNPDHAAPFCTMIYGALCRAARALGYREAWTYTLPEELGTSLRAAGFADMGWTDGGEHDRPSRPRAPAMRPEPKRRWMRQLAQPQEDK